MAENIENNGCSQRDNAEHEWYVKASIAVLLINANVTRVKPPFAIIRTMTQQKTGYPSSLAQPVFISLYISKNFSAITLHRFLQNAIPYRKILCLPSLSKYSEYRRSLICCKAF